VEDKGSLWRAAVQRLEAPHSPIVGIRANVVAAAAAWAAKNMPSAARTRNFFMATPQILTASTCPSLAAVEVIGITGLSRSGSGFDASGSRTPRRVRRGAALLGTYPYPLTAPSGALGLPGATLTAWPGANPPSGCHAGCRFGVAGFRWAVRSATKTPPGRPQRPGEEANPVRAAGGRITGFATSATSISWLRWRGQRSPASVSTSSTG
jgi:hypothetical protein